jgi:copper chaperone CopZ
MRWIFALLISTSTAFATVVEVQVNGMVCSMCAQGIKKKFSAIGVEKLDVDLDKKIVRLDHPAPPSDEKIKSLIEESGYAVKSIRRQ